MIDWKSNPWCWVVTFRVVTDSKPEVKHRPILFSGEMVRAILDRRKTQTRRPVRHPDAVAGYDVSETTDGGFAFLLAGDHGYGATVRCPFGAPGDRLWVRETWGVDFYDGKTVYAAEHPRAAVRGVKDGPRVERWRPSIHMPRWASRLTLEVVDVRVQRLQEISGEDARAEGVRVVPFRPDDGFPVCDGFVFGDDDGKSSLYPSAVKAFSAGWDSIYGARSPSPRRAA